MMSFSCWISVVGCIIGAGLCAGLATGNTMAGFAVVFVLLAICRTIDGQE